MRNCLIADNLNVNAAFSSRAGDAQEYYMQIENCTLANNNYSFNTSAANVNLTNHLVVLNCIITDPHKTVSGSNLFPTNNIVHADNLSYYNNALRGADNRSDNPLFVNAAARDYRLQKGSPAINTAIVLPWMVNALDLDKSPRIDFVSNKPDLGCYERKSDGTFLLLK